jgi:hypothetical protein
MPSTSKNPIVSPDSKPKDMCRNGVGEPVHGMWERPQPPGRVRSGRGDGVGRLDDQLAGALDVQLAQRDHADAGVEGTAGAVA